MAKKKTSRRKSFGVVDDAPVVEEENEQVEEVDQDDGQESAPAPSPEAIPETDPAPDSEPSPDPGPALDPEQPQEPNVNHPKKSFVVKPGLRLSSKHRSFWCIGRNLQSGVPVDVPFEDINDAQMREILTKKDVHVIVEEISIQVEVEDEIGG